MLYKKGNCRYNRSNEESRHSVSIRRDKDMSLTAAVINAGIGDLSLGLQMAGFQIAVAFEPDERAAAIHQTNLHNEIIICTMR